MAKRYMTLLTNAIYSLSKEPKRLGSLFLEGVQYFALTFYSYYKNIVILETVVNFMKS